MYTMRIESKNEIATIRKASKNTSVPANTERKAASLRRRSLLSACRFAFIHSSPIFDTLNESELRLKLGDFFRRVLEPLTQNFSEPEHHFHARRGVPLEHFKQVRFKKSKKGSFFGRPCSGAANTIFFDERKLT